MNNIQIREGSINEVLSVQASISELGDGYSAATYESRLQAKHLILIAEHNGPVGFKVGYELNDSTFYSWMGGVMPSARKKGIAAALLQTQEQWVRERGYRQIEVKTRNRHRNMLLLLISRGYLISDVEAVAQAVDHRIRLTKSLG